MKFNKKHLVIVAVALAVFGVALVIGLRGDAPLGELFNPVPEDGVDPTSNIPNAGEELTPAQVVTPAAPGVAAQLRVFDMTVSRGGFSPDKVVVNEGDTVSLRMAAGSDTFDIVIPDLGLHQTAVSGGSVKTLEFQASAAGTYPFRCQDFCPGGAKLEGVLLIKKVGNQ